MKQELIVTGSTIEEALRNGAEQLGVMPEELKYEVLVEPKKGILGIGRVAAKLKVCYEEAEAPAEKTTSVAKTAPAKRTETAEENNVALRFVRTLLEDMELEAEATIEETDGEEKIIRISGKDAGSLIGYHGETMDALQYLTNLAANKKSGEEEKREYQKILLDIENYREKRAETLKALARRMAGRVLKFRLSGPGTKIFLTVPHQMTVRPRFFRKRKWKDAFFRENPCWSDRKRAAKFTRRSF